MRSKPNNYTPILILAQSTTLTSHPFLILSGAQDDFMWIDKLSIGGIKWEKGNDRPNVQIFKFGCLFGGIRGKINGKTGILIYVTDIFFIL